MLEGKNITLISLNFHPENTAIGLYSTQLAHYLQEQGATLHVITAFPYYPQWKIADDYADKSAFMKEDWNGMTLYRFKQYVPAEPTFIKRIIHLSHFTFGSFVNLWKINKCDAVISVIPFTTSAFLGYILKKRFGIPSWVHIQDFEFDAAFQSGLVQSKKKKKGWVHRILMGIERSILNRADRVSTISHLMLDTLQQKTNTPTYFLPNWIDPKKINPVTSQPHRYLKSEKFTLLYSGSIGDKQDWELFMQLVALLDFNIYEIVIVGDGAARGMVEKKIAGHSGIILHPPVPYDELSDLLCGADAHFLFQKGEVLDTVMPSKILGMMASAVPSIISGHPKSEVNQVMQESNGGYYVIDSDAQVIHNHLETLRAQPALSTKMGNAARSYVIRHFSKEPILQRFVRQLSEL